MDSLPWLAVKQQAAQELRLILEKEALTFADVARILGMGKAHVSEIANGNKGVKAMAGIAEAFGYRTIITFEKIDE